MTPRSFPIRAVARLFLERQQLDRPRGRRLTGPSLVQLARQVGGIQLDSINVLDRAHHLTLWSRFGNFDRQHLDRLVYQKRLLFEYWAHAACLVATDDFPAWRRAMVDYSPRDKAWGKWLKTHRPTLRLVEAQVRDKGPIGTSEFQRRKAAGGGWWNWKPAAHALDYLWMSGVIGTHSRRHFQKRFDLTDRLFPGSVTQPCLSREAFWDWHVERSLQALGAATDADLAMYLTFPRRPASERKGQLRRALESAALSAIRVDHRKEPWYVATSDLPQLEQAADHLTPPTGTTFLCPFDSFLWHRSRVNALFGFDYRIEVYVPAPNRRFGYYVLPLWHDGRLIGRADLKTHRQDKRLELRALHFEPWFGSRQPPPLSEWGPIDADNALAGTATALRSLAAFVGAEQVSLGKIVTRTWRTPLARALKAAPALAPNPHEAATASDGESGRLEA